MKKINNFFKYIFIAFSNKRQNIINLFFERFNIPKKINLTNKQSTLFFYILNINKIDKIETKDWGVYFSYDTILILFFNEKYQIIFSCNSYIKHGLIALLEKTATVKIKSLKKHKISIDNILNTIIFILEWMNK